MDEPNLFDRTVTFPCSFLYYFPVPEQPLPADDEPLF